MTSKYFPKSDKVVSAKTKEKTDSLKVLLLASLAGCMTLGMQSAQAAELADIDMSQKPSNVPTLDYLNQNNVTISSEDGSSSTIVTPSSYTLTKVDAAGDNTITKFEWDESTKSFNPVYYKVDLKQKEFGSGSQSTTVTLTNPPLKDVNITVNYDKPDANVSKDDYGTVYENYDKSLEGSFSPSHNKQYGVGAAVNNSSSKIIESIDNALFQNNVGSTTYNSSKINYTILGGAIYNEGTIKNISADFINNEITPKGTGANYVYTLGGAIANLGTIENLDGNFINNTAMDGGGAIYNAAGANIGALSGNFVGNTTTDNWPIKDGGAILNEGKITSINANFFDNISASDGGAIYNSGTVEHITGDFISNSANSGGAIYNTSVIGSIAGNFVENDGGAIYNYSGSIGKIDGNFISNSGRGAIYNQAKLSSVSGNFIRNSSTNSAGAIYTSSKIDLISGTFIENTTSNFGGAIFIDHAGTNTITADFVRNYASSGGGAIYLNGHYDELGATQAPVSLILGDFFQNSTNGDGGAIHNNNAKIGVIKGDFVANSSGNYGGAIYNVASWCEYRGYIPTLISEIEGYFVENHAGTYGGAIANVVGEDIQTYETIPAEITSIKGLFINNKSGESGGAIYNDGDIGSIKADFYQNNADYDGGAISNYGGSINTIEGDFTLNNSKYSNGGAISIYSGGSIGTITGDFTSNTADGKGGAIADLGGTIKSITGDFTSNSANESGGAIALRQSYSTSIGDINGNFTDNTAHENGGAIYLEGGRITSITGDFIKNKVIVTDSDDDYYYGLGGAIANTDKSDEGSTTYRSVISNITGDFVENSIEATGADAKGGAIYNEAVIENVVNSSFIGNSAKSTDGSAQGGAIYNKNGEITISATDNYVSRFEGNTTNSAGKTDDNAIYMDKGTMNFAMSTGGKFLMKDSINGKEYKINISGDDIDATRFYMYNDMTNADLSLSKTTIDAINNQVHTYDLNSLTVASDTKFYADVDLANETMDRFTANSYGSHQGNLIVSGMNLISDAPDDRPVTEIYFAEQGLKDNVINGVSNGTGELPDSTQTTLYTPIYKYTATYDNRDDGGYFVFARPGSGTGNSGTSSDAFNPSVLASPVTNQAANQATMTEAFKYVFEHADAFTQLPAMDRMAYIKQNMYALSTDYNSNLGTLSPEFNNKAGWVRPYVTLENMHLDNGPTVDATTYGTLVGFDTDFQDLKHGWVGMTTGYIGYNGSQLSYDGVDASANGGLLGATQTFYKGNFWTAITGSVGASVGEAHTMYGSENYTSLLAGVASKTGYNFEFKEGRYIIQPIMYISYTFANTFDYTNAAGVKIENDPMHTIQLHPQVRFIMNTKNNWQPYIAAGVVWNPFNSGRSRANGIVLPEMSIKPYAEYGVGLQKRWDDKFTAFGQAMVRSGGRNGVALTFGFRWNIGKDKAKDTNEQVYNTSKKVIKKASR